MNIIEPLNVGGPAFFRNDAYLEGKAFLNGSTSIAYVEKADDYTPTELDNVINVTSGTFTITLPTAVGIAGRMYTIKNSGAGTVTIDGSGAETIDGAATVALSVQWTSKTVVSTGTNWITI